ncbi:MAG: ABC transporter substrate-binding protein [Alicyclobacillus macrosporangiidus]|uniref:ABC transporter substrate-binding protein n=1 Tax=Alicyclobacillus macrosporangiidus TaxID=392015 RepID=UPI0026ECA108|nr:ABC transporter substrate-binding protein [Alicyclobacillus macrosporangiidus]MCL6598905.1 ABC transporter substrate-binding protein [Alicyclobacillus macrosporangiidus]
MKNALLSIAALGTIVVGLVGCGSSTQPAGSTQNAGGSNGAQNDNLPVVDEAIFSPPSLGAFLPVIIEQQKLDVKNGIHIRFHELSPDAYNTEFASGQYPVGGSAAILSEGLRMNRGVKVSYVFNLFDFWGALVTSDPSIKTLKDLQGKTIAAAKSTTNYAMFEYFAKKEGVDPSKLKIVNADTQSLITYALAGRADAVQLWEPGYSTLIYKYPTKFHLIDFGLYKWKQYTGADKIPYLGVAVNQQWAQGHADDIKKIYQTYVDAAKWVEANPSEAAQFIAKTIPGGDATVIENLIRHMDRLAMDVQPAKDMEADINAVLKAGVSDGYLTSMPDSSIIYSGSLQ